jgi:tetratricopeptide (TPR) repeat protein
MSRLKRLIVEIHDRSLWQVLLVYAGGSWAVLEAVAFFRDEYGLPGWLLTVVLVLLVVGLFVVVVLSFVPVEAVAAPTPAEVTPPTETEAGVAEAEAVAARRRVLTWRNAGFAFVGVLAVWGLVAAGWVVLGGTGYLLFRGAAAGFVEPEDCVVVAEFENETDRDALGLAVREAVVTDIWQTSYVTVLGDERLLETLGLMRLPDTTHVDQHLALEIASRENCPAVVAGTVAPLGTGYSLAATLLETETGDEVARLRETAADETEVIGVVERLAHLVRRHLGESLPSIRRSEPLERVTTSSLEALKSYSLASSGPMRRGDWAGAIRLLEQAVALDTAFAEAYRKLGSAYGNAGRGDEGYRSSNLAYRFRERLPERERLRIVGDYHWSRVWADSMVHYYELGLELYPNPDVWSNNLAIVYNGQYRFEDAVAVWLKLLARPTPGMEWQYAVELAQPARSLGRHGLADSALAIMRQKLPPGDPRLIETAAWNAYYAGDLMLVDSLARELEKDPRPGLALLGTDLRVLLAAMYGRMDQALALAADWLRFIELAWFVAGTPERALPNLDDARSQLTLGTGRPFEEYRDVGSIAWGYALAGDVQSARELLAVQDSLVENNDFNPIGSREYVLAVIALQEGRAEDAVQYFSRAKAAYYGYLWWENRALLAEAHAALGNFNEAIAQYDTLTGTYRLHDWDRYRYLQLLPLAHERLGSLYLEVGDTVAAARHLAEFIELWKDADPELLPRVARAQRLLAQLGAEEPGQASIPLRDHPRFQALLDKYE